MCTTGIDCYTGERKLFYQALNAALDDDLDLDDYIANFRRMFGNERMDAVVSSINGSARFHGLSPTSMRLGGLDGYHRLIDSYRKIHAAGLIRSKSQLGSG